MSSIINPYRFAAAGDYIAATSTGSTVTTDDTNYKVHVFNGTGTFTVTNAGTAPNNAVELLLVGGGAGTNDGVSGGFFSGGGGAGSYYNTRFGVGRTDHVPSYGWAIDVTVGGGGAAFANGGDSEFDGITAVGGGYGSGLDSSAFSLLSAADYQGCGGGGCYNYSSMNADAVNGGVGTSFDQYVQAGAGYSGGGYPATGGGGQGASGGGAGGAGIAAPSGGTGGLGKDTNMIVEDDPDVTYATGGVGNSSTAGGANTGDGAGGYYTASAGGSGIVVIRYKFQ